MGVQRNDIPLYGPYNFYSFLKLPYLKWHFLFEKKRILKPGGIITFSFSAHILCTSVCETGRVGDTAVCWGRDLNLSIAGSTFLTPQPLFLEGLGTLEVGIAWHNASFIFSRRFYAVCVENMFASE